MDSVRRILEFTDEDLKPLSSFNLHKELNPVIWKNFKLKDKLRRTLLSIANDYVDNLDFEIVPNDIILTGSLANFNYSDYSDYDLHILIDFSKIDANTKLVKKFLDADRKNWNDSHDIKLKGYEVEIYSQDISEPHTSTGIYSILNDEWIIKPTVRDFKIDTELIRLKTECLMNDIDEIEKNPDIDSINDMFKQISKLRKDSISTDGEFGIGNLVFKTLRRNDYLKKLDTMRDKYYDKRYEDLVTKILHEADIKLNNDNKEAVLDAINEIQKSCYQNPFGRDLVLKDNSALLDVVYFDNSLHISSVSSIVKGGGTKAMNLICRCADMFGVDCTLVAKAFGTKKGKMSTPKLKTWYKKFGFTDERFGSMIRKTKQ